MASQAVPTAANGVASPQSTPTKRNDTSEADPKQSKKAKADIIASPGTPPVIELPSTPPASSSANATPQSAAKTPTSAEKSKLSKEERKRLKEQTEREKAERKKKREDDKAKKEEEKKKKAEEKAKLDKEKDEEKKRKEEEKQKKDEERKKKEEERLGVKRKKEGEMQAKEKTLQGSKNLMMAFVKKAAAKPAAAVDEWAPYLSYSHPTGQFLPMSRAPRTTMAPIARAPPSTTADPFTSPPSSLAQWQTSWKEKRWGKRKPREWMRTIPRADPRSLSAMKLFFFHDNENKPIYFGTYSKKSTVIKARRPCSSKDETLVDYVFDSDAEWVEEEPGESLEGEDGEEEEDKPDSEDELAIVPDGYLSADEGLLSEDDDEELPAGEREQKEKAKKEKSAKKDGDDDVQIIDDKRKRMRDDAKAALYKERKDSAAATMRGVFLYALPTDDLKTQSLLKEFAVVLLESAPIKLDAPPAEPLPPKQSKIKPVSEEALVLFAKFIHGRVGGIGSLVEKFRQEHPQAGVSIAQWNIRLKSGDFASKEMRSTDYAWRWYLKADVAMSLGVDTDALLAERAGPSTIPSAFGQQPVSPEKKRDDLAPLQQGVLPPKTQVRPTPEKKRDLSGAMRIMNETFKFLSPDAYAPAPPTEPVTKPPADS